MAVFARYDGIDGESQDAQHPEWIDVQAFVWGMHRPDGGGAGQSRRRGSTVVENLSLTIGYEKASPKLEESCLDGRVIPKLEIEQTVTFAGGRVTLLRYELRKVTITNVQISGSGDDEAGPPVVVIGNRFERITVTYSEYGSDGTKQGDVDYDWKAEKGDK